MSDNEDEPKVEQVPLREPRPLTPTERGLIDFLLAGPLGRDELREQAMTARVVGVCSCGCPSVWLGVDPDAPLAKYRDDETPFGDAEGWMPITARQRKSRGSTEVTLHVVGGRMHELEVWTGGYGVRPRIDLTKLQHDA